MKSTINNHLTSARMAWSLSWPNYSLRTGRKTYI